MICKKCLVLCGFLLVLSTALPAQAPDSFQLLLSLPLPLRFATADHLGNLYGITPANRIEKHAPDGRLLAQYSNNRKPGTRRTTATPGMKPHRPENG
jgi:hypothetical protein